MEKQDVTALLQSKNNITKSTGLTHININQFRYTWLINNYQDLRHENADQNYLESQTFYTSHKEEYTWRMVLFPSGIDDECNGFLSVRIRAECQSLKNEFCRAISIELSLLNAYKEELAIKQIEINEQYGEKFKPIVRESILREFVRKDFVFDESNELLTNGALTVLCKIFFIDQVVHVKDPDMRRDIRPCETERRLKQLDEFEQLLFSEKFSDFRLAVGGKEFPVHRNILAANSRIFAAMMEEDAKGKKEGRVEIDDFEPDVVREMLRFVYVGKVDDIEKLAHGLLAAAEKYELEGLKLACEEMFISGLRLNSVAEVLMILDKYTLNNLKAATMELVAKNAKVLSKSEKFKDVTKSLSSTLLAEIFNMFMTD